MKNTKIRILRSCKSKTVVSAFFSFHDSFSFHEKNVEKQGCQNMLPQTLTCICCMVHYMFVADETKNNRNISEFHGFASQRPFIFDHVVTAYKSSFSKFSQQSTKCPFLHVYITTVVCNVPSDEALFCNSYEGYFTWYGIKFPEWAKLMLCCLRLHH